MTEYFYAKAWESFAVKNLCGPQTDGNINLRLESFGKQTSV